MAKPPHTVSPGRARFLWIGNLCLAAGWTFLAIRSHDGFYRALAFVLIALSLAVAANWFWQERLARPTAGPDEPH